MLHDLGSNHLPLFLSVPLSPVFFPNERPPSFTVQKSRWDDPATYFDSHCSSAEEYSCLFFPLLLLFTFLALNAAKSSIFFGRIKPIQKPGGLLRWKVRLGKDLRLSLPLTEVMKIAKAKAEAWPTTCSSLSPKSNLESVHSLCSIAGSSSSSPNFLNCSSPRESASIYAAYLRFNFSISQPNPCVAEPETTSLSSAESRALRSLIHLFALPFLPLNFLQLPPTFPRPLPLVQTNWPIPC